jgi:hypothetical protein
VLSQCENEMVQVSSVEADREPRSESSLYVWRSSAYSRTSGSECNDVQRNGSGVILFDVTMVTS